MVVAEPEGNLFRNRDKRPGNPYAVRLLFIFTVALPHDLFGKKPAFQMVYRPLFLESFFRQVCNLTGA